MGDIKSFDEFTDKLKKLIAEKTILHYVLVGLLSHHFDDEVEIPLTIHMDELDTKIKFSRDFAHDTLSISLVKTIQQNEEETQCQTK